ncbi:MAG: VWA domain-containing protein [Thermoanaerobaculia bacterium]|nr:VWA domain-containing protein [Thermoanaerobaculia bacterium]
MKRNTKFAVVLALAFAVLPVTPQESRQDFSEVVDVRLVNVDVFVNDRDGNPVTGLTHDDFEVRVDGNTIEISNFYPVDKRGGRRFEPRPVVEPTNEPAAGEPAAPEPKVPEAAEPIPAPQPTWLVIYVDNANIKALHRTRVLRDIRVFLRKHDRDFDQILVASFEGSLHIRQPFTRDPELVSQALLEVADLQSFGDTEHDELYELIRELEDQDLPRGWVTHRVEAYAQQRQNELRRALVPMRDLIDSIAGLDGHKALLYISDGVPLNPGEELFNGLQLRFEDVSLLSGIVHYTAVSEWENLSMAASAAGVTFYTLDATGLTAPLAGSAEVIGSGVDNLRSTVGSVRTANLQAPLRKLAGETGGVAILNSNRVDTKLERLALDAGAYYSLGFHPPHARDGRFHDIKIRVQRKGVTVRHRNGYRDEPLDAQLADLVKAGLRWNTHKNPLGLQVRVSGAGSAEGDPSDRGTRVIAVELVVPLDAMQLVARDDQLVGRLQAVLAVQDADGKDSPPQSLELPVTIPAGAYEKGRNQHYVHELDLRVRPGSQRIGVSMWDIFGQQASTAVARVSVGE